MTMELRTVVRDAVEGLVQPVDDIDAVTAAVVERSHASQRPGRSQRLLVAAAVAALALVVAGLAVGAQREGGDATSLVTQPHGGASMRLMPSYVPDGWILSSAHHQQRRDDPALRSVSAYGEIDELGRIADGYIIRTYRPAIQLGRNTGRRIERRGGRTLDVDEETRSILVQVNDHQVLVDYAGLRLDDVMEVAGSVRVDSDGNVDLDGREPTFESRGGVFERGARWIDITYRHRTGDDFQGRPTFSSVITIAYTTGQRISIPTLRPPAEEAQLVEVNGHSAHVVEGPGGASLEWKPDKTNHVVVAGRAPLSEIRRIAENLREVTLEEWDAYKAAAVDGPTAVSSGTTDGVEWQHLTTTAGSEWIELNVPLPNDNVRVTPDGGGLGGPVVRSGRHTVVGFFAVAPPDRVAVGTVAATRVVSVPMPDGRVAVAATFDKLLSPRALSVSLNGSSSTVDLPGAP